MEILKNISVIEKLNRNGLKYICQHNRDTFFSIYSLYTNQIYEYITTEFYDNKLIFLPILKEEHYIKRRVF